MPTRREHVNITATHTPRITSTYTTRRGATAGLRDTLIHSYFRVDRKTIDDIVTKHVPRLAQLVREQRRQIREG